MNCEVWSMNCEAWTVKCDVWPMKSLVSLYIYLIILENLEVGTVIYELSSVKSELWTVKLPPVFRSFVLNSLWTFIKDIWQAEHTCSKFLGADGSQFCQNEGLDGGFWNSLISKNLTHYSLSLKLLLIL